MINYISLFSGIGGFELGIQKSKYNNQLKCIGFSEVDKSAIEIYRRHFPNHKWLGDVREIKTEELPRFELLVGGFPCQSFSNCGFKQGFADTRGTLFFEIARILKDCRPPYFLLENVQSLLWNKSGETFQTIIRVLTELGYIVSWEILDSRLFGVPQRRQRLFIKGVTAERCGFKIPTVRRFNEKVDLPINSEHLKIRTDTTKGYKEANVGDGVRVSRLNQKNGGRGRVHPDAIGTLMCSCDWGVVTDDLKVRRLTPLECERLQGFSDHWTKFGEDGRLISDSERYKFTGNAVTVPVIQHIFDNWELKE